MVFLIIKSNNLVSKNDSCGFYVKLVKLQSIQLFIKKKVIWFELLNFSFDFTVTHKKVSIFNSIKVKDKKKNRKSYLLE